MNVTIFEKREKNTRTRPVKLQGRILNTHLPDDEVNFFSEHQMDERTKAIVSIKEELSLTIVGWLEMTTPIQTIQEDLKDYFTSTGGIIQTGEQIDMDSIKNHPNKLVIDCSGYNSLLLDQIQPNNRVTDFTEYVIVWDFTINARYECNEKCKYYKNANVRTYQVIPSVHDTYIDKNKMNTQVTCLITISKEVFDRVSKVKPLTFDYLLNNLKEICDDMDTFLKNFAGDDINRFPNDVMTFVALPLHVYHAKKSTHIATDFNQHWVLMGDAAIGGPYFQSISTGYEAAIYFAYIFKHMDGNVEQMLSKYEAYMEKLWFTIQVRSREIKRNKDILRSLCAKNIDEVLQKIKIY